MTSAAAQAEAPRATPWWRPPLYPLAFGCALVLLVWVQSGLHPSLLVRPLVLAVALSLGLTLLASALLRDRDRGALVASVLLLILLTSDERLVLLLLAAIALIVIDAVAHRGRSTRTAAIVTRVMSTVGAVLVAVIVVTGLQQGALVASMAHLTVPSLPAAGPAAAGRPDIYLLLLDAYPGDRAAAESATFDADEFPDALTARGFEVVRDAHSNYLMTPMTVASMLSMRHLVDMPALDPPFGPPYSDSIRLQSAIDDAPALETLRANGYETIAIDAGFANVSVRRVDQFLGRSEPSELERIVLANTRLDDIVEAIVPGTLGGLDRRRVEGNFATVEAIAAESHRQPRFVFAHISAPHPPWVFHADGSPRRPLTLALNGEAFEPVEAQNGAGFDQATHVGHLAIRTIDAILRESPEPPVIVVMSDHGPLGQFSNLDPSMTDVDFRASSFMAILAPGHPGITTTRPTPVNLFPTLFGALFEMQVDRQPDSIWTWRGDSYLDAVEVPPIQGWTR